ncbi:hypothetical protein CN141_16685 [Sinorhizobium meliloti]|nr:hypothetical protein CN141_16685 [Sinorhizobium meliloti]
MIIIEAKSRVGARSDIAWDRLHLEDPPQSSIKGAANGKKPARSITIDTGSLSIVMGRIDQRLRDGSIAVFGFRLRQFASSIHLVNDR